MNSVDVMVESWHRKIEDDCWRTPSYMPRCDHCQERKNEESKEWCQSKFTDDLWFCCEDCKRNWESEKVLDYM